MPCFAPVWRGGLVPCFAPVWRGGLAPCFAPVWRGGLVPCFAPVVIHPFTPESFKRCNLTVVSATARFTQLNINDRARERLVGVNFLPPLDEKLNYAAISRIPPNKVSMVRIYFRCVQYDLSAPRPHASKVLDEVKWRSTLWKDSSFHQPSRQNTVHQ